MTVGEDNPGDKAPICYMVSLTSLKSCTIAHFPDFLLNTNVREFQGE